MTTGGTPSAVVQLRELIGSLPELTPLSVASPHQPVRGIEYLTDIDAITTVRPDTVIVLSEEASSGSWMVSAALRFAWERRACALVISGGAMTEAVTDLAQRLEVSLLTAPGDMLDTALQLSTQLGVAQVSMISRVHAFERRILACRSLDALIEHLSEELGGASVRIERGGVVIAGAAPPTEADTSIDAQETRVTLSSDETVALVAHTAANLGHLVTQILEAASVTVRALIAEQRLAQTRVSLPLVSLTSLVDAGAGRHEPTLLDPPAVPPVWASHAAVLAGDVRVVCILTDRAGDAGSLVHALWSTVFPDLPLAQIQEGWIAFLPDELIEEQRDDLTALFDASGTHPSLRLRVGVSERGRGFETLHVRMHQAWLAARLAGHEHHPTLLRFEQLQQGFLPRLIPASLATEVLQLTSPQLLAHEQAFDLMRTAVEFMRSNGSIAQTATNLQLHRNTVQQRLQKLRELGCDMSDPERVLALHMLFTALTSED